MINNKIKALFAITLSTSIIGLSYVCIKMGVRSNFPINLLADRLAVASIMTLILRGLHCFKVDEINKEQKKKIVYLSLLYPIGFFALQIAGIKQIQASEASLIYTALPIFTLLISAICIKEKTTLWQKIGAVLSVGGVFLISFKSINIITPNYWGYFFIFCSLTFIAFYFIFLKKMMGKIPVSTATYYLLLYGALITNIANIGMYQLSGNRFTDYFQRFSDISYIYIILFLGLFSTLTSSFLTNYSLKHLSVTLIGIFNNLSPIIGLLASILVLHEKLYSYYIYGGIIVLIGIAMSTIKNSYE